MNNKDIKRLVAREGLIIISILLFYFINNWIGNRFAPFWFLPNKVGFSFDYYWYLVTQFFLLGAYPLYLLIRFIVWALKTIFPERFILTKIEKLFDDSKYAEALELLKEYDKESGAKEKNKEGFDLIRQSCVKGYFVQEIYRRPPELMKCGRYREAKEVCEAGYKFMLDHSSSFGLSNEVYTDFREKLERKFSNLNNFKLGELKEFFTEFESNEGKRIGENTMQSLAMFMDLFTTHLTCDIAINSEKTPAT